MPPLVRHSLVRALLGALAIWLVGFELSVIVPSHPGSSLIFGNWLTEVVQLTSAALCFAAACRHRGRTRIAWVLIATGIVVWTAGDIYWLTALAHENDPPIPSLSDLGYLLFEPLVFAGLVLLIHDQLGRVSRTVAADGLIAILAAATVSAALVIGPVEHHENGGTMAVATNLAYPISDLGLCALVFAAFVLRGWRFDPTWALLGAGTIAFCIADGLYLVTSADGTYSSPSLFDIGWVGSTVLFAAAAWAPARPQGEAPRVTTRNLLLPLGLALVAIVVALVRPGGTGGPATAALGIACAVAVMGRLLLTFRENQEMLAASQAEARTDPLTGLGNRRALIADVEAGLRSAHELAPLVLVLFDLDGFKHYNDNFGHEAGDDLLVRLSGRLTAASAALGRAYRIGGDEFCVLLSGSPHATDPIVADAVAALSERGDGYAIRCSHGGATGPREAGDASTMLRVADQRMYAAKHSGRASAGSQSKDVLVRAMLERDGGLAAHVVNVADLAEAIARRFGLDDAEVEHVRHAAELHDIGKVAIPIAILDKPGPLDDREWVVMRQHTVMGERIIAAAPSLGRVAAMVRSSHERYDGTGYPDGLAGDAIPLGARIVAVCDAFDAMITKRTYNNRTTPELALAELRRCAGTQFDPAVVVAFCDEWAQGTPSDRLAA